jgi:glucan phosphoethanolaminetransferase (alkaline phosphatase superfamily)
MALKNTIPSNEKKYAGFVFQKINYILFLTSILIVALGFLLMMGTEDIYSFTKITLAPLVVIIGFAIGFVAILYKPKNKDI